MLKRLTALLDFRIKSFIIQTLATVNVSDSCLKLQHGAERLRIEL